MLAICEQWDHRPIEVEDVFFSRHGRVCFPDRRLRLGNYLQPTGNRQPCLLEFLSSAELATHLDQHFDAWAMRKQAWLVEPSTNRSLPMAG